MQWWTKLLPFLVVQWLAKRHCSLIMLDDGVYAWLRYGNKPGDDTFFKMRV